MRRRARRPRSGFTLVELLIVTVIIGIIVSLILTAAFSGVQAANREGTRALIAKLDAAIADRLDALLSANPTVTGPATVAGTHQFLASIPNPGVHPIPSPACSGPSSSPESTCSVPRCRTPSSSRSTQRPCRRASREGDGDGQLSAQFRRPECVLGQPRLPPARLHGRPGEHRRERGVLQRPGGIAKGLGYDPQGYDGIDNDGNGAIDDWNEGLTNLSATQISAVVGNLQAHTHKTARAEMLYAMLTEGIGPFGSAFSKDDFTAREVQDTDGDGLPEFVDAWGEPLQFYRWPLYFASDTQKGFANYTMLSETRERSPLDPNQQLAAPAWFMGQTGAPTSTPAGPGTNATTFQSLFFMLVDPQANGTTSPNLWDRGSTFTRRAYNWKPLIVSSGPDKLLGVGQLNFDYTQYASDTASGTTDPLVAVTPTNVSGSAANIISIENLAAQASRTVPATSRRRPRGRTRAC